MERLRRRQDFLAAAKGKSVAMPGMVVQSVKRSDEGEPRLGFTCSRKIGNAVARNRAKRRLREVARASLQVAAQPGHDYVIIGRAAALTRGFDLLRHDLAKAIERLNGTAPRTNRD
jgi:ribonuclease P protein component